MTERTCQANGTRLVIERALRGRARYHQALGRGDAVVPVRLRPVRGWLATACCSALLLVVFGLPVAQLVAWSVETIADGTVDPGLRSAITNTLMLAVLAAAAAVVTGMVVAYGQRVQPSRLGRTTARIATVGYGVPGTVVAVAVYVPLVWLDRRLVDAGQSVLGTDLGLPPPANGDLSPWFERGVMLLNRVLTVCPGRPASHQGKGWETVTAQAISGLAARGGPLVAILWGRQAQSLAPMLGQVPRIESAHPSPLSARSGFFGSGNSSW